MQITGALSKRYPRFWVGAFARWDRLAGAAFTESPLVRARTATTAGIGVAWVLGESRERVESRD
jgi:hypothetical protein